MKDEREVAERPKAKAADDGEKENSPLA